MALGWPVYSRVQRSIALTSAAIPLILAGAGLSFAPTPAHAVQAMTSGVACFGPCDHGTPTGGGPAYSPRPQSNNAALDRSAAIARQFEQIQEINQRNQEILQNAGQQILNILQQGHAAPSSSDDEDAEEPASEPDPTPSDDDSAATAAAAAAEQAREAAVERARQEAAALEALQAKIAADQAQDQATVAADIESQAPLDEQAAADDQSVTRAISVDPDSLGSPPPDVTPTDPDLHDAAELSQDADQGPRDPLGEWVRAGEARLGDAVSPYVKRGKTYISQVIDDKVFRWSADDQGSFTTIPPVDATDTAETASDKVYAQAAVGFGKISKSTAEGLKDGLADGDPVSGLQKGQRKGVKEYADALRDRFAEQMDLMASRFGLAGGAPDGSAEGQ